jgi:hypothetical protein
MPCLVAACIDTRQSESWRTVVVSTLPVAVPWAEPLAWAVSPDVFTLPVAEPVALPDVFVVSVTARPVSGAVSTFAVVRARRERPDGGQGEQQSR